MKESYGGVGLFMIVVFFVVLFTGYLCLSVNQTRAFNVKNSIIRVVERYGTGVDGISALEAKDGFSEDISSELEDVGYRIRGVCPDNAEGFNTQGQIDSSGKDTVFCIEYVQDQVAASKTNPSSKLHYFKVTTFYHFDIPIINNYFKLTIKGDTKAMM